MNVNIECQHDQCIWEKNGVVSRWKSNTKASRNARCNHHRKKQFHPCCANEERCATGKRVRSGMEEPPVRRPFLCKHTGCSRDFASPSSRSAHHKNAKLHSNCRDCYMCTKHNIKPQIDEVDSVDEVADPETVSKGMEELVASVSSGESVFQSSEEFQPPISALSDAIVLYPPTPEGARYVSRFTDEFARATNYVADVLKDSGIPPDKHSETIKLLAEHDNNLQRLFSASSIHASRAILNEDPALADILNGDDVAATAIGDSLPLPSLAALLEFKDACCISDTNWKKVEQTCELPVTHRLSKIKALRATMNSSSVHRSPGGRDFERDLLEALRFALTLEKPETTDVTMKISFDEGNMTRRRKSELATMDIITETDSISTCKSFKNNYCVSLFSAGLEKKAENSNSLEEELGNVFRAIHYFHDHPEFTVAGRTYNITPLVCLTLECYVIALGLLNVWKSNCTFRCVWCAVTRNFVGDFTIPRWPLRSISDLLTAGEKMDRKTVAEETKRNYARDDEYQGCWKSPLIKLPITNLLPSMLHTIMSMAKLLRSSLWHEVHEIKPAREQLLADLQTLELKLGDPTEASWNFLKLKFNRVESLRMLKARDTVLRCLSHIKESKRNALIRAWNRCYALLCIAAYPPADFTEDIWIRLAKLFAIDFKNAELLLPEKTTSCLHTFVYHFGFFIATYGGLERTSNCRIEGWFQHLSQVDNWGGNELWDDATN